MPLASQEDVEARLGRPLTVEESARLPSLLSDATAAVIGYCRTDFEPSPYPDAVVGVTAKMIVRLLSTGDAPLFAEQQAAGPFSVRYNTNAASGDVYFTKADKLALRPYRLGSGVTSVLGVSDRYDITPTVP